jgi:hypothetical protein
MLKCTFAREGQILLQGRMRTDSEALFFFWKQELFTNRP